MLPLKRKMVDMEEQALEGPRRHEGAEEDRDGAEVVRRHLPELTVHHPLARVEVRVERLHHMAVVAFRVAGFAVLVQESGGARVPDLRPLSAEADVSHATVEPVDKREAIGRIKDRLQDEQDLNLKVRV